MEWNVVFTRDSYKQYQKLKSGYQKALKRQINKLTEQKSVDIKPIQGYNDLYRLRLGKYRAIIKINYSRKEIFIINIKKRSTVYKKY